MDQTRKKNQHLTLEEVKALYGRAFGVIYRIYCTDTGISYVGQTRNISARSLPRVKGHYTALKKGCHPNRDLQAAWDATGGKSIKDEILEVVENLYGKKAIDATSRLLEAEKRWQEHYKASIEVQPKKSWHYALKAEELRTLKDVGVINNATLVYFALKLKNPWCDRPLKINPLELAVEWDVPESSVYEAIAKLKEAEVIQINKAEIVISWPSYSQQDINSDNSESVQDSILKSKIPECTLENQNEIQDSRTSSETLENPCPEPAPDKASTSPHTIHTYSDFINTLSKNERESFEKYVREEWRKLTTKSGEPGEEIISLERFLAREEDQKNWWDRFVNSSAGRAAKIESEAKQYDWENDPRFMDWLHKAYCEGYPWTQENEAEREQRTAFLFWAQRTNAYAGRIEHESA